MGRPLLIVIAIIVLAVLVQQAKKQKRLAYLRSRYQAEDIVQKIYYGYSWLGQTEEQLIDSLGNPVEVDRKVLKTMRREIWKYNRTGANRFGLRITVENGHVAGWEKKA